VPVLGTGAPPVKVNPGEGPTRKSHDGKRLAFLRHSRANQEDTLVVANADGSNEQTIATRKWPDRFAWDWATAPAWTRDDQSLALPIVNSEAQSGSAARQFGEVSGFFVTIFEIRLTDRTSKIIQLSPQRFEQPNQVSILSDSSAVILSARGQGASFEQVWYLGRDGIARSLTNDLSDYRNVVLTDDSTSFVTTQTQTLSNIWIAPKGDSSRATQVTSGFGRYFDLSWAPKGTIVYASDASGSADIYEISANGNNVRQLTSNVKRNYAPQVSPDDRYIVFHSNRSGVFQIWRMERDGSNPVQLTFGNSESHWPQFSSDGKFVIYQHFEPGVNSPLWRIPVGGGTPAKLSESFAVRPAVSRDGKWLGFWYNDGQPNSRWKLGLSSPESGTLLKTFEVAPTVQVSWDTFLRWDGDSRGLTYVNNTAGVENVWIQPIAGGPAKQLTHFVDSRILSFDWSAAGDLVVSRGLVTSDVVLITDVGP
jgi:Tol biopolymer transport system component